MPNKPITDYQISKTIVRPGQNLRQLFDSEPGLRLRITRRAKFWRVRKYYDGQQHHLSLGEYPTISIAEARRLARQAITNLVSSGVLEVHREQPQGQPAGIKWAVLLDRYIAERLPDLAVTTAHEHRRKITKHLRDPWKSRRASSISFGDVRQVIQPMINQGKTVLARRTQALIGAIFSWAIQMDAPGITTNPISGRPKPGQGELSRERVLTDAELTRLVTACRSASAKRGEGYTARCTADAADLIMLELYTGQRGGEYQRMQWSDLVDDENEGCITWTLTASATKNRQAHLVPLPVQAVEILRARGYSSAEDGQRETRNNQWVFPNPDNTEAVQKPSKAIRGLLRKAKCDKPIPATRHDLRRTFATRVASLKSDPANPNSPPLAPHHVIAKLLNHRSVTGGVTFIYNRHEYLTDRKLAVQAWADQLDELTGVRSLKSRSHHRRSA